MDHSIRCECGHEMLVSEGSAGAHIPCLCGRIVEIPSLSALRKSMGLSAVEVPLEIDAWSKVESGELPPAMCIGCGVIAEQIFYIAECEQIDERTSHDKWPLLQGIIFTMGLAANSLIFAYRINGHDETVTTTHGREVNIPVPVRCCTLCRTSLVRKPTNDVLKKTGTLALWAGFISVLFAYYAIGVMAIVAGISLQLMVSNQDKQYQQRLKKLLSGVPFYKRVFEKYPDAVVKAGSPNVALDG